jgi:endonuclease YncB( thermonuclease family)
MAGLTMRSVLLLLAVFYCATTGAQEVLSGKVTRIVDGDTLDVLLGSGRIRVRLHGIDAPERDQPGGREARRWLQRRLIDHSVQLQPVSQDRYERMVAIVQAGGSVVNEELLQAGHAWAYRHYLRRADHSYCDMEERARRARLGLWAGAKPHAPWQYRQTRGNGPFADFTHETARSCRRAAGH